MLSSEAGRYGELRVVGDDESDVCLGLHLEITSISNIPGQNSRDRLLSVMHASHDLIHIVLPNDAYRAHLISTSSGPRPTVALSRSGIGVHRAFRSAASPKSDDIL